MQFSGSRTRASCSPPISSSIDSHAWVGDGDVPSWRRILKTLEGLDPEVVVPGHGPVGTGDDIALVDAYLARLLELEPGAPLPPEFEDLAQP